MIKFFSKTRQRLVTENKFSKYLIYAIGEIVLVVIGILIALGINNWNEGRKNEMLEQKYIQELKVDLRKDSTSIRTLLTQSNAQVRAKYLLKKYLVEHGDFRFYSTSFDHYPEIVKSHYYNKDSLTSYFHSQWQARYHFTPITTTIDEMKSTGKIGVIKDHQLRRSIIETYNSYESYKLNYENIYQRQQEEIYRLIFDEVPALYKMDNSSLIEIFKEPRVLNRFEGSFVIGQNSGLIQLEQVNQKLLNELNLYTKIE